MPFRVYRVQKWASIAIVGAFRRAYRSLVVVFYERLEWVSRNRRLTDGRS
jgi:hypothetical protein